MNSCPLFGNAGKAGVYPRFLSENFVNSAHLTAVPAKEGIPQFHQPSRLFWSPAFAGVMSSLFCFIEQVNSDSLPPEKFQFLAKFPVDRSNQPSKAWQ